MNYCILEWVQFRVGIVSVFPGVVCYLAFYTSALNTQYSGANDRVNLAMTFSSF